MLNRFDVQPTKVLPILFTVIVCGCNTHYEPGAEFTDCGSCPSMVVIPSGSYRMGDISGVGDADERPVREVTISSSLAVGKYPVTRAEFALFVSETGHEMGDQCYGLESLIEATWESPGFEQTESDPVVCVNWNDASAYLDWLSDLTGFRYRFLTEAEWEYAGRAGTETRYSFGDDANMLCQYANGADASITEWDESEADYWAERNTACDDGFGPRTSPAGHFLPNPFGLYDMEGNVWEWVMDCKHEAHSSYDVAPTDGSAVTGGSCDRMMNRGGSWDDTSWNLRLANRGGNDRVTRYNALGFRVARDLT